MAIWYYIGGQGGDGDDEIVGPYRSEEQAQRDCDRLNAKIEEGTDYWWWVGVMTKARYF